MTVFTNIWHLTRVLSTCLLEALSWKITFHNLMLGKWGWKTVACPTIKYFQSIDRTLYPTHGTGENIYYLKLAIVFQAQLAFKKKKNFMAPFFMDGVQLPQGYSHFEEAVYFLPFSSQKFVVILILSTSQKDELSRPWSHPVVLAWDPWIGNPKPWPLGHCSNLFEFSNNENIIMLKGNNRDINILIPRSICSGVFDVTTWHVLLIVEIFVVIDFEHVNARWNSLWP